jgi:biotin carboxylase
MEKSSMSKTSKHVLVIGGPDDLALDAIEALGLRYSMVQAADRVAERQYRGAERYAVLDYTDVDELIAVALGWHSLDRFAAVVSFTEEGLGPASCCAAALGVPGDNLVAVRATRDRCTVRELVERHGLGSVRHRVCADIEDARDFLREQAGAPIVVKPWDRGLGQGVHLVRSEWQLDEYWPWISALTGGSPILAEEFLTGPEFGVETLSLGRGHEVVLMTEKKTARPHFVEVGCQVPARLTLSERAEIEVLVKRFLELIGQGVGPAHTKVRLTARGPRLIGARTTASGEQTWELCRLVSGADLISETVATLADVPLPPRTPAAGGAAVRFFDYEDVRILDVSGLEDAAEARGVARLDCTLEAGQELGPLQSASCRQGYILCTGADTADAVANAEAAHALVKVLSQPITRRSPAPAALSS